MIRTKKNIVLSVIILIIVLFSYLYIKKDTQLKKDIENKYSKVFFINGVDFLVANDVKIDSSYSIKIFQNFKQIKENSEFTFLKKRKGEFLYFDMNLCSLSIIFNEKDVKYDFRILMLNRNDHKLNELEKSYLNYLITDIKKNKKSFKGISKIVGTVSLPEKVEYFDLPLPSFIEISNFDVDSLNTSIMEKIDSE